LTGIMFMLYDFVTTPLQFFELPESTFLNVMGWITRIFWIVDIVITFQTATFVKGVLTTKWCLIAKEYVRKMFVPDLLIVLAEWLAFIFDQSAADSNQPYENVIVLRVLKVLRFAKVMRIFKLEQIMAEFKAQINSTFVLLLLRPVVLIIGLLFFNHMIACFWYGLGISSPASGWLSIQEDRSSVYLYATSLHWAMSMLHGNVDIFPRNAKERVFQCSMTIVALVMFSTLLSSITSAMMQIHSLRQERFESQNQLREVLARRHISAELTARIKKRLDYNKRTRIQSDADEKIIQHLPPDLVVDLFFESRTPLVHHHTYFFMLGYRCPRILRQLCSDAMEEITQNQPDETIFSSGDACQQMFFISSGHVEYLSCQSGRFAPSQSISLGMFNPSKSGDQADEMAFPLTKRDYICEPVLWMTWEYCGLLTTRSPVCLLSINAQRFTEVVKQFHFALVNTSRYAAEFLHRMVKAGRRTDLALPDH